MFEGREMTKTIIIAVMALTSASAIAGVETNTTARSFATPAEFSKIIESNGTVVVTSPDTQVRFLAFMNGTNVGFADLKRTFSLKSGDILELVEKHTTIKAEAKVSESEAELTVTKVHDARSFGQGVTTNVVVLKQKRK
jgi:hypothetical protein